MLFGSQKFASRENISRMGISITIVRMETLQHIVGRGNMQEECRFPLAIDPHTHRSQAG